MNTNKFFFSGFIFVSICIFFSAFLFRGLLPIPSDTIVGLYHPFRDSYAKNYPRGLPFKNFLITDPVRQQYPWRQLAITGLAKGQLPLWNPYSGAGYPLLGNMQSSPLYPLNILYWVLPFSYSWSILVLLQPLLAGFFLYFYLRSLQLQRSAATLGAFAWSFCGFSIAWLEWNTILHVGLWLPLILLSIHKIVPSSKSQVLSSKIKLLWLFIFVTSLFSSFFAGHLQTFFYLFAISLFYFSLRWIQYGKNKWILTLFFLFVLIAVTITSIQWTQTFQLINFSARDVDQSLWQSEGWFIPWQHLIQFVVPDFFGNPATLNYWGVWNYAEFVGYIGIVPLIFALFALFFRHDKKTFFFGCLFFTSLLFALPTFIAQIPYILDVPFFATAQPTRLLFVTDFSLAILAALGFDLYHRKKEAIVYPIIFCVIIFLSLWFFVFFAQKSGFSISNQQLLVAKQNLFLPTALLSAAILLFVVCTFRHKSKRTNGLVLFGFILLTAFDLLRFGLKFTPFTQKEYLFPSTKAIDFLQKKDGQFRIMTTDSRILPPNFSVAYKLQSVEVYDPLYLRRYAELIAASERGKADISPPFGFNRIITPRKYDSRIMDLLGVKYVLSLSNISSPKLKKVFQEGETRIYENQKALPKVFFVENTKTALNKQQAIEALFDRNFLPGKNAVVEVSSADNADLLEVKINRDQFNKKWSVGTADILMYSENRIKIKTKGAEGFLVLTDSYYPGWRATVDGEQTQIFRTDYNFRGIIVPKGSHIVDYYTSLF